VPRCAISDDGYIGQWQARPTFFDQQGDWGVQAFADKFQDISDC
jgi:hypothetical protein